MNQITHTTDVVKQAAREAGFEVAGVAPVRDFEDMDRFREWIAAGRAGEMQYMAARDDSGSLKRASLRATLPWVHSVVVCAINYNTHNLIQPRQMIRNGDGSPATPGDSRTITKLS